MTSKEIKDISITEIIPGPNDRKVFNEGKLVELADSIDEHGLAQPMIVRPVCVCHKCGNTVAGWGEWKGITCAACENNTRRKRYEIVAGERRFRAMAEHLYWSEVPCIVREYGDEVASEVMLAENTGREDLNPMEEARAYEGRVKRFGWGVERIAKAAGVNRDRVARRMKLLRLAEDIQHFVEFDNLPIGHAEVLCKLDHNRQRIAVKNYNRKPVGKSQFVVMVNELYNAQSQDELFSVSEFWQLQSEVVISSKRGKGAKTGAPGRNDVPRPEIRSGDNTGSVMDRYIAVLLEEGFEDEAKAMGVLYDALVHSNHMSVPDQPELL
jgi:ParB/RepB/Spo0J family partition protein